MLIARQDGRIFLHDISEKALLCEVALPKCYMLHRALDHPAVVTASAGRMLYAIGNCNKHVHSAFQVKNCYYTLFSFKKSAVLL